MKTHKSQNKLVDLHKIPHHISTNFINNAMKCQISKEWMGPERTVLILC